MSTDEPNGSPDGTHSGPTGAGAGDGRARAVTTPDASHTQTAHTPSSHSPDRLGATRRVRLGRILALIALLVALVVIGRVAGVADHLTVDGLRSTMQGAGVLGFLGFLVLFAVGELLHVPGVVFVVAAIVAYGRLLGGIAGFVGAVVAVVVSFTVVRLVGGQPLAGVRRPWMQRMLAQLDRRPIRVVALLRVALWMAPPLNYALAMSTVRFRDYLLGSALGLVPPIAACAWLVEWVVDVWLAR